MTYGKEYNFIINFDEYSDEETFENELYCKKRKLTI